MIALIVPLLAMLMVWLMRAREDPSWFIERHASEIYRPSDEMLFVMTIIMALASVPLLGICVSGRSAPQQPSLPGRSRRAGEVRLA